MSCLTKAFGALITRIRFLCWMGEHVTFEHRQTYWTIVTHVAHIWSLACVCTFMNLKRVSSAQYTITLIAWELSVLSFPPIHDRRDINKGCRFTLLLLLLLFLRATVILVHCFLNLIEGLKDIYVNHYIIEKSITNCLANLLLIFKIEYWNWKFHLTSLARSYITQIKHKLYK